MRLLQIWRDWPPHWGAGWSWPTTIHNHTDTKKSVHNSTKKRKPRASLRKQLLEYIRMLTWPNFHSNKLIQGDKIIRSERKVWTRKLGLLHSASPLDRISASSTGLSEFRVSNFFSFISSSSGSDMLQTLVLFEPNLAMASDGRMKTQKQLWSNTKYNFDGYVFKRNFELQRLQLFRAKHGCAEW